VAGSLTLTDFPGKKTLSAIYAALPGKGIVKAIVVGVGIGAVIVAGITAGLVGIPALLAMGAAFLTLPLLLQVGILVGIAVILALVALAIRTLINFNFDVSDATIDAQIKSSFAQFYGSVGEFLGKSIGYAVCGALPGSLLFCVSPSVARVVFSDLSQEVRDELYEQLAAMGSAIFATVGRAFALMAFKSARKWIKKPGTLFHNAIKNALGEERFKEWGDAKEKNWSIAHQVEEQIEDIENPELQNFSEEAWQGLLEGCDEGLSIVNTSLQSQISAMILKNKRLGLNADEEVVLIETNAAPDPA
jgi:hypothetical protein